MIQGGDLTYRERKLSSLNIIKRMNEEKLETFTLTSDNLTLHPSLSCVVQSNDAMQPKCSSIGACLSRVSTCSFFQILVKHNLQPNT